MFGDEGRFILDQEDDNKFWMTRADYFITDSSFGYMNFVMTALKPALRMLYEPGEGRSEKDEWGWRITNPDQFPLVLEEIDDNREGWKKALQEKQKREMPTLGQNFRLLATMR